MVFTGIMLVFLAEGCHSNQMMYRTLSEENSNLRLRCLLLHIFIHRLVQCDESLQLMLKFQAPINQAVNFKEMTMLFAIWGGGGVTSLEPY
jgi:hypothetical protein